MEQDSRRWQDEIREIRVRLDLLERGKTEAADHAEKRVKLIRQELIRR